MEEAALTNLWPGQHHRGIVAQYVRGWLRTGTPEVLSSSPSTDSYYSRGSRPNPERVIASSVLKLRIRWLVPQQYEYVSYRKEMNDRQGRRKVEIEIGTLYIGSAGHRKRQSVPEARSTVPLSYGIGHRPVTGRSSGPKCRLGSLVSFRDVLQRKNDSNDRGHIPTDRSKWLTVGIDRVGKQGWDQTAASGYDQIRSSQRPP
ncbi:unnamed protein product [Soboliphyme baturini]|uniref:Uncharacterized protein n=1 Tax=Soboliphyme baturini TaxID=241478 RepID=A0A183IRI8_9BILA|nr:unnamed protein product [Soboliphyme baturini]